MKNYIKEEPKQKKKGKNAPAWMRSFSRGMASVLNGNFLTAEFIVNNLSYIIFVSFLALCYIAYGYFAEQNVKTLYKANLELKDLKAESLNYHAELEKLKQQSQVAHDISDLGLHETTDPPRVINTHENQN